MIDGRQCIVCEASLEGLDYSARTCSKKCASKYHNDRRSRAVTQYRKLQLALRANDDAKVTEILDEIEKEND